MKDATQDRHGIVLATIPATVKTAPTIAWIAHVDTSPETSGQGVRPIVHRNYDGDNLPAYFELDANLSTRDLYLFAEGETVLSVRVTDMVGAGAPSDVTIL